MTRRARRIRQQAVLAAFFCLALALAVPAPILASCAGPPQLGESMSEADTVFVGTVTAVGNLDRTAEVEVAEVWKSPEEVPPTAVVHGGLDDPNSRTSVDRTFAVGTRYLFVAFIEDGVIRDNSCSATSRWDESLAAFLPENARPPSGEAESSGKALPVPVLGLVLIAALVAAASVYAFLIRR